jgi:hypothetical protein
MYSLLDCCRMVSNQESRKHLNTRNPEGGVLEFDAGLSLWAQGHTFTNDTSKAKGGVLDSKFSSQLKQVAAALTTANVGLRRSVFKYRAKQGCRRQVVRPSHQSFQLGEQCNVDFVADAFCGISPLLARSTTRRRRSQVDKTKFLSRFDLLLENGILRAEENMASKFF